MKKSARYLILACFSSLFVWGLYRIIIFAAGNAVLPNEIVRIFLFSAFVLLYPVFKKYQPTFPHIAAIWFLMSLILCWLKNEQYLRFVSTGFDLGIRANILYNIIKHGRVWDSLNQAHGFSGHFWPAAFPLALLLKIWFDPRVLLFSQAVWLASAVFPLFLIMKNDETPSDFMWLFLVMFLLNHYFHNINSFDFHPESLGTALVLWFLYFTERGSFVIALILMAAAFTLKEDIPIAFGSLALYGFFYDKKLRKFWMTVGGLSLIYFILALVVISNYGSIGESISTHYAFEPLPFKRLEYALKFFASMGFLPLLSPSRTLMFILPFFEHILSSWKPHFHLSGQYTAMLLPISFYVGIRNSKLLSKGHAEALIVAGILISILQFNVKKYLPDKAQLPLVRYEKIDSLLSTLPDSMPVAGGNHITPHIALRDSTYQLPLVLNAKLIVVDTTWHDFYPLDEKRYRSMVDSLLKNGFENISNDLGLMMLKRR